MNRRPCDVVEDEDELDGDADQDAVFEGPEETGEEGHETRNQIKLFKRLKIKFRF